MAGSQWDGDPIIQEFLSWRIGSQRIGSGNDDNPLIEPKFVPYTSVNAYFGDGDRIERLIGALFQDDDPGRLPEAETIRDGHSMIFCILLSIGKGTFINHFVQNRLDDLKLPYVIRPPTFPVDPRDPEFWTSFFERQWEFSAPKITYNIGLHFESERWVLPIIHKEKLSGGGSAITYKVILHEDYDLLDPHGRHPSDPDGPSAHTYVLKTYRNGNVHRYYKNEVEAFKRLRFGGPDPNIIGFYGSFLQVSTYNVLLEYADQGTLEKFFETTPPPSTGEDIIKFWNGLFSILKALKTIHGTREGNSDALQILNGWHQDVKPANVLVRSVLHKSKYEVKFFLADLGLSHFRKTAVHTTPTDRDSHGTRAYGAPECYSPECDIENKPVEVKQNVDIWSAGCVLSEAAVWVVHGYDRLLQYRQDRKAETDSINGFTDGGCFHDGVKVLKTVSQMHQYILRGSDTRGADHVTKAVLWMTEDMLSRPDGRPSAQNLYVKSGRIIDDAKGRLGESSSNGSSSAGKPTLGTSSDAAARKRPRTPPELPVSHNAHHPWPWPESNNRVSEPETTRPESTTTAPVGIPRRLISNGSSPSSTISENTESSGRSAGQDNSNEAERSGFLLVESKGKGKAPSPDLHMKRNTTEPQHLRTNGSQIPHRPLGSIPDRERNTSIDPSATTDRTSLGVFKSKTHSHRHAQNQAHDFLRHPPPPGLRNSTTSVTNGSSSQQQATPWNHNTSMPPHPDSPMKSHAAGIRNSALPNRSSAWMPPPQLSVAHGLQWKKQKKTFGYDTLDNKRLFGPLHNRDFAFLIDDAASMAPYWNRVKEVFGLLAYMVKEFDKDGMDLHFTMSSESKNSKKTTDLLSMLDKRRPNGHSDLKDRLGTLLDEYIRKLNQPQSPPQKSIFSWVKPKELRRYNIYVFTDAVWQPHCNVEPVIRNMVEALERNNLRVAQIGIQFIRFGHNEEGIRRLNHLDSGMQPVPKQDIVDTEPSDGNVWKMLLGAINPWFDDDEPEHGRDQAE